MKITLVLLIGAAAFSGAVMVAAPFYIEKHRAAPEAVQSVRKLYFAAHDGNRDAANQCSALLADLVKQFPDDPLVLAYFGSLKLRESQTTIALWRKGKLAKQGLEALDQAVKLASDDLEVRFIRGATTFHLPGFFKREEQARRDFAWLSTRVEEAASEGRMEPRFASAALYYHGVLLEQQLEMERSRAAWQAALRVGPGTHGAAQAAKKLK